jgi:hypothetical protein
LLLSNTSTLVYFTGERVELTLLLSRELDSEDYHAKWETNLQLFLGAAEICQLIYMAAEMSQ